MSAAYADLTARLAAYLAAEAKALKSQEYQVGSGGVARRTRMAELAEIRAAITELQNQIDDHPDNPARALRPRRYISLHLLGTNPLGIGPDAGSASHP